MNLITLKERIALSDAFTPDERNFLLDAINATPEAQLEGATMVYTPNKMPRIESIYAYLSVDKHGEGVCAAPMAEITAPLIAADLERLKYLKPMARHIAKTFNRTVRLVEFTTRRDIEVIRP